MPYTFPEEPPYIPPPPRTFPEEPPYQVPVPWGGSLGSLASQPHRSRADAFSRGQSQHPVPPPPPYRPPPPVQPPPPVDYYDPPPKPQEEAPVAASPVPAPVSGGAFSPSHYFNEQDMLDSIFKKIGI